MRSTPRLFHRPAPWIVPVAALVLVLLAPPSLGDSVKLSGFWIDNVTVNKIEDGKVIYVGPAGNPIEADLASLEGLKLDAYPRLGEGLDAAEADDVKDAIKALREVHGRAKEAWLKRFLEWKLLTLYNRASDGPNAIRYYLALIDAKANPAYLDNPPINAAAAVPADQAEAVVADLTRAMNAAQDDLLKEHLDTLIGLIRVPDADDPADEGPGGTPGGGATAPRGSILLPANAPESATLALIKQGQLDKALASARRDVTQTGGLSEKLFFKGLIERAIADASDADDAVRRDLYKDAGLSFMRIVVHFPRSRYAPLALLEAGYIHERIGQPETAARLYAEAEAAITPEDYPQYHARLLELTGDEATAAP